MLVSTYSPANPTGGITEAECLPQYIPNVLTTVLNSNFHLTEFVFANVTAAGVTVTISDLQPAPLALFNVTIPANSTVSAVFRGRLMLNGFTWLAGTSNAVVGSFRGY